MSEKPDDLQRILHMQEAIDRIIRFSHSLDYESFLQNEMAQFAIIKNYEIIGEAAYHLSPELRDEYPEIEWRKIMSFRHILVHDYYKINSAIVWNAQRKLEELGAQLERILTEKG